MAAIQAGSIFSSVEVRDNSAKGLRSAQSNIKSFQHSTQELQDKLFPIQNLMKGGMFAGASMAGISAVLSNFSTLGSVVQSLSGSVPKMGADFLGVSTNVQSFSGELTGLDDSMQTTTQWVMTLGTKLWGTCGSMYAVVSAAQNIVPVFTTTWSMVASGVTGVSKLITEYRGLAEIFSATEAATEMLIATGAKSISVRQLEAAKTLLQTNYQAGAIVMEKMGIVSKKTLIAATMTHGTVSGWAAIKNGILAASTTAVGIASRLCAGAVWLLNAAWQANPFGVIVTTLIALGAAIYGVLHWLSPSTDATGRNTQALLANAKAAREAAEAQGKLLDTHDANAKSDMLRLERLTQLSQKQSKSPQEFAEMERHIRMLNLSYRELNLTMDEAGTVDGIDAAKETVKADQRKSRIKILKSEEYELLGEYYQEGTTKERRKEIDKRRGRISQQLEIYDSGSDDNIMGVSDVDYLQKKIDAEKQLGDEKKKVAKDQQKYEDDLVRTANENALQEQRKTDALIAELEADERSRRSTALQNELDLLHRQTAERREALESIIYQKMVTGESSEREIADLKQINQLESQRKAQIEEKYRKQSESYSLDFAEREADREKREKKEERDEALDKQISANPFSALKTVQEYLDEAERAVVDARFGVENTIAKAQQDGIITEDEQQDIATAQKKYDDSLSDVSEYKEKLKSVQGNIASALQSAMDELSKPMGSIEAINKGSVEALKKEMELNQQGESPEAARLNEILKMLEGRYNESEKRQDKIATHVEALTKGVKAV